ncbi:hypothetical protein O181_107658 [Austropuccinia psidii MF-1]|uniref:Uncharacterized protein n=1 Tax=Austropuccinia psidii MF-1 TaxID=1389203 RepID=A0A9Q3JSW1_9BASI|nr:hypothetical protein [Austropuccinia psidii MF-1]
MSSGNHQRPPDKLSSILLLNLRGILPIAPCTLHPVLKVAGVVHIWYYIPLCTIFAQQFNGDIFRTKFHDSKLRSQNPIPILKEDSSAHQSGNPRRLSEDYSRTPTTWPCSGWVGSSFQHYSKGHFSGVLHHFNQLSRQQVLQHPLANSIGSYR